MYSLLNVLNLSVITAIAIEGMINSPLSIEIGSKTTLVIVIDLNTSLLITKPDEQVPAILRGNNVL